MKDINKKTLIEALSSLREYEPPKSVWENIELEMDKGLEDLVSPSMLRNLPEYDPPESVWEHIENNLYKQSTGRIVQMQWRRTIAVAASLALLLSAYFLFEKTQPSPELEDIAVNYSTEVADDLLLEKDWEQDAEAFELYKELCSAKKYICEHPEFQVLQSEFDELSEAVKDLETALGQYGTSADLVIQIKEIELERTDVFKKMMVMLI